MSPGVRGSSIWGGQLSDPQRLSVRRSLHPRLTVQAAKELEGTVVSTKMQKTIVVSVTRSVKHSKYLKWIKRSNKFYAHDEDEVCKEGDYIRIVPTRPLSKTKRYVYAEMLRAAK